MRKSQSPAQNPTHGDQRRIREAAFSWTHSMSLFTRADKYIWPLCNDSGFQSCLLKPLDHHLSLPIDKLSTYKFWSLLGSLLNFPFHILCQQLPRGREKKPSPYPSFKKSNFHSASPNPLSRPTNVYYIIREAMLWWCSTAHVHVHHQSYILLICLWV